MPKDKPNYSKGEESETTGIREEIEKNYPTLDLGKYKKGGSRTTLRWASHNISKIKKEEKTIDT